MAVEPTESLHCSSYLSIRYDSDSTKRNEAARYRSADSWVSFRRSARERNRFSLKTICIVGSTGMRVSFFFFSVRRRTKKIRRDADWLVIPKTGSRVICHRREAVKTSGVAVRSFQVIRLFDSTPYGYLYSLGNDSGPRK